MFDGFSKSGLKFLGRLPQLDKEGFQGAKARYKSEVQDPTRALVDALGPVLKDRISSSIEFAAKTNGSIGPINSDRRFNPDAPAYKDHLLLRFWDGPSKKTAPTLFVRLTPTQVGFATGMMFEDVGAWRTAVDHHGALLAESLADVISATNADVVGKELKRVPAPYGDDHERRDLLRHKWLQVRWPIDLPSSVFSASFVGFCADELVRVRAIHLWMLEHLS